MYWSMTIKQLEDLLQRELRGVRSHYSAIRTLTDTLYRKLECLSHVQFDGWNYYIYLDYMNKRSIKVFVIKGTGAIIDVDLKEVEETLHSVTNRVTRIQDSTTSEWATSTFGIPNSAIAEQFQRGGYILAIMLVRAMIRDKVL